jgi:two-component system cell cycle sensor histidine kinase PleC
MTEFSAASIEKKREAEARLALQKRALKSSIRDTREKLTSDTGLNRADEYEMVRLFAQSKASAAVVMALFTATMAASLLVWQPASMVIVWLAMAFTGLIASHGAATRFLAKDARELDVRRWGWRFTLLELLQSALWCSIGVLALGEDNYRLDVFVIFALLMYAGMSAVLAASIPKAVYVALLPATAFVALVNSLSQDMTTAVILFMYLGAMVFYVILSNRLHATARQTVAFRAEKDNLIAALELEKSRSDEARRRAEDASLAKSRFLATMSHELRTPLNAILGFSEVMKSELFGAHANPQYKQYALDIHSSGQHLLGIINEILDLSRIEAGRYELNEEAVDFTLLVDDCTHMLDLRARNRGLTVHQQFEKGLPRIWVDERAVRQVTINLLANAIKFTPQGGEIWVKVGWTQSGGQYLSIRDNGPGIPEDELATVLTSFGRGTTAIKNAEQGTGLGLPIVKGLVDLHNGAFHLRSKLREGTEVIVIFPPERVLDALAPLGREERPRSRRALA